ncbi:MAG TPA: penicillin acylase family protein [Actinomycetaceae bacterium]|nr:penicillin acylase family protein [Actinomycetaceae bacterium]
MKDEGAFRRRILIAVAAFLVAVLALAVTISVIALRRPLPAHAGTIATDVGGEVRIERDARGVAHIYADNDSDLFFAQGYVHAQDRFFEMDYRRKVTAGRLSELVGESEEALNADRAIRTLGWRFVAEQEWPLLSRESQSFLTAYADGVNAYIAGREASQLGFEYMVLGLRVQVHNPEPWTPVDSLTWLKAMAWDLRSNYDEELERAASYQAVGDLNRIEEIFPGFPYAIHAPVLPSESSPVATSDPSGAVTSIRHGEALGSAAIQSAIAALEAVPTLVGRGDGIGSNSFVVSGEHTESGQPILANDPHLVLGAPNLFYQVGLHCTQQTPDCTFDVGGFSFAGMPGVIIGHNSDLAWGLTNMGADVTDFFLERVYSNNTYEYDGDRVPLERRTETIVVNGADPVQIDIRSTAHGPIISDILPEAITSTPVPAGSPSGGLDGYEVSLRWTALDPGRTVDAIFAMNRASTAEDVAGAAALFEVPAQAIVFATTSGDIGFQAPGRIPIRPVIEGPVASDGTWPRPGWDPAYEWQGFVASEDMPSVLNPGEGFVVAANQAVTAPGEGPFLGADVDPGFRSNRIRALLNGMFNGGGKIAVESANEIMLDSKHPIAEALVPIILQLELKDDFVADAVGVLAEWRDAGYPNDARSSGAAFFNTVWAHLVTRTFADELGDQSSFGDARWIEVVRELLASPQNRWWDDVTTVSVTETRDEILLQSLQDARAELTNTQAKDPARWLWGDLHQAQFTHPVLSPSAAPAPIARLMNPAPFPVDGGTASVNATNWAVTFDERGRPDFSMTSGPAMRMVVDLADLDASTWVVTTGTSGHPSSGHFKDQLAAWRDGESYPWPWTEEAVTEASQHTLTLTPGE